MVDPQATEARLARLEASIEKLLDFQKKAEERAIGDKVKDKATDTNDGNSGKEDNSGQEGEKFYLVPKINCLSWPEWRKLRLRELEAENSKQKQKDMPKKVNQKPNTKAKQYVIDLVSDVGDMGPPAYTENQLSTKCPRLYCRIRINSQHILDILSDITSLFLPQRCQMLHPFKVIIDNIAAIKAYVNVVEDELERARAAVMRQPAPLENMDSNQKSGPGQHHVDAHEDVEADKFKEKTELVIAQEKVDHYRCFMELIETKLALEVNVANAVKDGITDRIMFCHLWHLFPPGETIYHQKANPDEPPQATQVLKVSGGRARLSNTPRWFTVLGGEDRGSGFQRVSPFTIDAFHLDFDGKKFRPFQVKYEIAKYAGAFLITSLPVFPIRFLPGSRRSKIMTLLLNRGLNFRTLAGVEAAHREYCGRTLDPEPEDIDGRVIIDFEQASVIDNLRLGPSQKDRQNDDEGRVFGLRPLSQTNILEVSEMAGSDEDPDVTLYNDHNYDIDKTEKLFALNKVLLTPSQELTDNDLGDDDLRLLPGTVYAYILRSRKYCRCDISFIKEITPNKTAFDHLVLPTKYKKLLKSLVDSHSLGSRPVEQKTDIDQPPTKQRSPQSSHTEDTLSIVKGKGRGLIILLHGVPGVGKTSTAETIAETTGRPLLPVTCGDIGENARDVEKNLEQIFTNSHRWGCVLLLDEAEVFLTKRNLQDLARNAMVSVVLRALEFYSGILFLTTNRVGTIDEAFKSRIHISLYYPPHDWKTSKQIWRINLRRCCCAGGEVRADEEAILRYAKRQFRRADESSRWNGRQIYNAFKTAIALAEYEGGRALKDEDGDEDEDDDDGEKKEKKKNKSRQSSGGRRIVLTESHFRQVAQVARKFDEYLLETYGGESVAAANRRGGVRADGFGVHNNGGGGDGLKRRPTMARKLDLDEMPSTSEGDSDGGSGSGLSSSIEGGNSSSPSSSEEEEVMVKKKSRRRDGSSRKAKKKTRDLKSKKPSKKQVEYTSEDSS
ncbi:putative P-loop containing nucleoside triphosphate hydrolase [Rosellinia necatrix]|uniref:Putative P-loop containing nucleoside triphosphate hydrolase n=1 Tax=Rosellinia necatrix TaxID=77044 RepID=A0A1W2TPF4_ROSNE|nr:putative P-loop containing nucleoside triphosphate hydrolase [Rosellinia necatrix]